jgi:rubredoxin
MDKYICTVCDYVYDPELGDPENGIEREHRLKIFLKIGFARYAELEKKNLRKRPKTLSFLLHHY